MWQNPIELGWEHLWEDEISISATQESTRQSVNFMVDTYAIAGFELTPLPLAHTKVQKSEKN